MKIEPPNSTPSKVWTFVIVTSGSVLFCSKGVVAKLAYGHGLDAISVLNLRMLMALPFFVVIALIAAGGLPRLSWGDWARLAGLGFVGYYLSSLVNFTGLQYISVGLERVILFSYPGILLILTALVLRKPVGPVSWFAATLAWFGILLAFGAEARNSGGRWESAPRLAAGLFERSDLCDVHSDGR